MKILKKTESTITYKLMPGELKSFLLKFPFEKSNKPYTLYSYQDNEKVITIYSTLKVVYINKNPELKETKKTSDPTKIVLGTDEVGTGDVFGGVCFGLFKIYPDDYEKLKKLKITDSKKLTDEEIYKIGEKLEKAFFVKALYLDPLKYNSLHDSFNLNELKAISHNKLIAAYGKDADEIVIDAFCSLSNYQKYLKNAQSYPNKTKWLTKAESKSLAVAGASIYARYVWLKKFKKIETLFNLNLPKGAGKTVDLKISELRTKKFSDFKKIAKLHFKNFLK